MPGPSGLREYKDEYEGDEKMVKIAVAGAAGRMGRRISALAMEHPDIELTGAFEMTGHKFLEQDMGELLGIGKIGVMLADKVETAAKHADVIIDFTAPKATLRNMEAVASMGKAMVIGTTGLTPCVQASNMSLGINLLSKVLGDVARALGDDYDVEIFEAHHKHKKDAPSGTALMLGRAVADALGRDLATDAVYCREGIIGERTQKEIGIQTIRAGDIVGEHTVLFGGMGERVEITHRASSRDTFARGALRAALWLKSKPAGLYDMQDVLGLK
jgi:4-hydroxy-tetrahydrodipicolinate reductase